VNRAAVLQRLGDYTNAIEDLGKVLLIDPKHKRAKRALTLLKEAGHSSSSGGGGGPDEGAVAAVVAAPVAGGRLSVDGSAAEDQEDDDTAVLVSIVGGRTGSGKTEILDCLRKRGELVLDLEGLANHRGSAFGAIGQLDQPSNEQYENRCALSWWRCVATAVANQRGRRRVWMEHEGPHVGKCMVPPGLVALVNEARGGFIVVEMSRPLRVARLVEDYCRGEGTPEELATRDADLAACVTKLRKKLGQTTHENAIAAMGKREYDVVCDLMLDHYDGLYDHHRGTNTSRRRGVVSLDSVDADKNAGIVLAAAAVLAPGSSLEMPAAEPGLGRQVEGLRLLIDVADAGWQSRLVAFTDAELQKGRDGQLIGKTYTAPANKWAERKQSREQLQYGVYTNSNRVQATVKVLPLPALFEELLDRMVAQGVFAPSERPDSCVVNAYEKGMWLPPHVDSASFARPFATVSLLSDQVGSMSALAHSPWRPKHA
jgi:tRNA 2-selenouridine synthase